MTTSTGPASTLVLDGAYKHLKTLTRAKRIPRFGQNGLPPVGEPLSVEEQVLFDAIGAPQSADSSSD